MRARALPLVGATLIVASIAMTTSAAARGRGRPKGPRPPEQAAGTTTPTDPTALSATVSTFRQFGSWLDDASVLSPGEGRTGLGVGYWRLAGGSQFNVPMLDVSYGFTNRLQASAAVPFYRTSFDGTTARGLDDVYLSAKVTAIDPASNERQLGVAVSPVLEVLSSGAVDGRVHVALPLSVELRRQPYRVYGSAGYFSRGSFFSGGAIEFATSSGVVLTGVVTQSYSLKDDVLLDSLGIGRQRVDVAAGAAYPVVNSAAAYVSVGRSLSSIEEGGTTFSFAAGVSFRFSAARATP